MKINAKDIAKLDDVSLVKLGAGLKVKDFAGAEADRLAEAEIQKRFGKNKEAANELFLKVAKEIGAKEDTQAVADKLKIAVQFDKQSESVESEAETELQDLASKNSTVALIKNVIRVVFGISEEEKKSESTGSVTTAAATETESSLSANVEKPKKEEPKTGSKISKVVSAGKKIVDKLTGGNGTVAKVVDKVGGFISKLFG
jgi:hypothetical protein